MSGSVSTIAGSGRYWGLATGLNVDSIVQGLTSDIQNQIDTAKADQQKLEWKQTAYREIISALTDFEESFLSDGSDSSMTSKDIYTSYSVNSSNGILSASSNSDCDGLPQTVIIQQSALTAYVSGGALSGHKVVGTVDLTSDIDALKTALKDKTISMGVDDLKKDVKLTAGEIDGVADAQDLVDLLNEKIGAAFGTVDGTNNKVTASLDNGKLVLSSAAGYESTQIDVYNSDAAVSLGISQLSNRSDLHETLGAFLASKGVVVSKDTSYDASDDKYNNFNVNINGTDITLNTKTMTVAEALSAINMANTGVKAVYNKTHDNITFTSTQSGSTGEINFGSDLNTTALAKALGVDFSDPSSYTKQEGRDAVINVNGTNYIRSSNNFTIDGTVYSINGNVDPAKTGPETSQLTFSHDTTKLEKGIKNFISAYNELVSKLTKYVMTKPDKDNYKPLTDAQKDKMTNDQIAKWEDKAKEGILFNDSTLDSIQAQMREAMYKPVKLSDGSEMYLYDIGITTTADYWDKGKLEIKSDDLVKFKDALASKTSKIAELFSKESDILLKAKIENEADRTQANKRTNEEGLMHRIDDIIKRQAGVIYGNYGTLLQIAGTDKYCTYNNFIDKQISDTKNKITEITARMKEKQDRLYTQFQALESYMSQANAQSSMVSSMLGSK